MFVCDRKVDVVIRHDQASYCSLVIFAHLRNLFGFLTICIRGVVGLIDAEDVHPQPSNVFALAIGQDHIPFSLG